MNYIRITLAAARTNAGLDQERAAKELGTSKNTIVNWEKGRSEPTISQARKLAKLYKISLDQLIFLPEESN